MRWGFLTLRLQEIELVKIILFSTISVFIILVSFRNIFNFRSHGFYRFLSWECIAWLFASSYNIWFREPFSFIQILSWIFLTVSTIFVAAGVYSIFKRGKPGSDREDNTLYKFEKTQKLVTSGIFKYIRHPLYSSLVFLTWGILLKNPIPELFIISLLSTIFLFITARFDEKECIGFFGDKYMDYMKSSKRFIPFIF